MVFVYLLLERSWSHVRLNESHTLPEAALPFSDLGWGVLKAVLDMPSNDLKELQLFTALSPALLVFLR